MKKRDQAVTTFNNGFNCSQAVLSAYCEELGLNRDTALKISTGFGGGLRKGEVCGAVAGAIMALGLKYGHCIEGDIETKGKAYALTKEFINRFEQKNGTILCKELLGYDLSNEQEYEAIKTEGLFDRVCPNVIMDSIDILEELLGK